MARKPVKKRKQQRASVKRKTKSVKAKPVSVKKPKPFNPIFNLKIGTSEDPFFIHPETIPDGVALQWIPLNVDDLERVQATGWKPVDGVDGVKSNMLVWAPKEVAKAQRDADFDRAKEQIREASALFGLDEYGHKLNRQVFPLVSPSFMVPTKYASIPDDSPSVDVDITIKFRVSARWQDAAACLGLEVQEYARRRLFMEPIVLGPIYEYDSDPKRIYEPVELYTKRID